MTDYKADLHQRYWKYRETYFANEQTLFNKSYVKPVSPPVFIRKEAQKNVIVNPDASEQIKNKNMLALIPKGEWHTFFGSMNSSQALAQSVLGNLFVYDFFRCLSGLKDDEGMDLFGKAKIPIDNFEMERKINYLGEPRRTSLDGYICGDYRVAIECKFTEEEVGTCSRPRLKPEDSNYKSDYCDGTYSVQIPRKERCSLTEIGVLYWQYMPQLFNLKNDSDKCLLNKNYQLIRNILAVGVKPNGTVSLDDGHVLLIYDERNPAFREGEKGFKSYAETRAALKNEQMLRKCSWQSIVKRIREKNILIWLTESLALKYGL